MEFSKVNIDSEVLSPGIVDRDSNEEIYSDSTDVISHTSLANHHVNIEIKEEDIDIEETWLHEVKSESESSHAEEEQLVLVEKVGSNRVSFEQRQVMLTFMKEHHQLASGRLQGARAGVERLRLLQDFSDKLHACATGATKSPDKWLKTWHDWKADVKAKANKIKRQQISSGSGAPLKPLSYLERELLTLIGDAVASGDKLVSTPVDVSRVETSSLSDAPTPSTSKRSPEEPAEVAPCRIVKKTKDFDERLLSTAEQQAEYLKMNTDSEQRQAAAAERIAAAQEQQNVLTREQLDVQEQLLALREREVAAAEKQASAVLAISNALTAAIQSFQQYLLQQK